MNIQSLRADVMDARWSTRVFWFVVGVVAGLLHGCVQLHELELPDAGGAVDLGPDLSEPDQSADAGELAADMLEPGDALQVDATALELDGAALQVDAGVIEQDASSSSSSSLYPQIFTWDYVHCEGAWADDSDSATRFTPHPDTGKCTFACVWQEPKCHEQWYGDPRCYPAYAAHLGQLCAELGGSCDFDLARSTRFCVPRSTP